MSQRFAGLFWAVVALTLISSYVYFRVLHRSEFNTIIDSAFDRFPGLSFLALVLLSIISGALSWKRLRDPEESEVVRVTAGIRVTIYAGFVLLLLTVAWATVRHVL